MSRRVRIFLFLILVLGQVFLNRYTDVLKLNADLFFLLLVYISIKSNFFRTVVSATIIGLVTDFLAGSIVIGVYGFSRTLIAFFLNEGSKFIDLRKNQYVFLLIVISLSFSNLIANLFYIFILKFSFSINLIVYQPVLTGLIGLLIVIPTKIKEYLNVY